MLNISCRFLALSALVLCSSSLCAADVDQTAHTFRQHRLNRAKGGIRLYLDASDQESILRIEGGYGIYDPATKRRVTGGLMSKSFCLKADQEGLCWGEAFPDLYQMTIVPEGQERGFYLKNRFYPGILHVYLIDGEIKLINEMPFEDFALAICSEAEETSGLEDETRASLAICARTQAVAFSALRHDCYWHTEARRVGYRGSSSSLQFERARRAQMKTRDLILEGKDRGYLLVEWTKHCAGHTVDYNLMHRNDSIFSIGQIEGVASPWAQLNREQSRWNFTVSEQNLAQVLSLNDPLAVQLSVDKKSGKVFEVDIRDNEQKKELNFYHLQKIFGARLKSSDFHLDLDRSKKEFTFIGYGEGAGVGLCLYSANAMAKEGKTAKEILTWFFPGSNLRLLDIEEHFANLQK